MSWQIWTILLVSNLECSKETETDTFALSKNSQWAKQVSTSSSDWGISGSLGQKTLAERKTCPYCWYQQCPTTWMNNSNWPTRWLTSLTEEGKVFVWFCCGTIWTNERFHLLKSEICKENGEHKVATIRLYEFLTWKFFYLSNWCDEFCLW